MAWTYDPTALTTGLNAVRLLIGDVDANQPQLQDEEIQSFIDVTGSNEGAAAMAARVLVARYARSVDKWVGDLKILASQRHRAYVDLLERLEAAGGYAGVPFAGGIRVSQKEAINEDTDLVQPHFSVGMHDNRGW